jgi:hypothetical protein
VYVLVRKWVVGWNHATVVAAQEPTAPGGIRTFGGGDHSAIVLLFELSCGCSVVCCRSGRLVQSLVVGLSRAAPRERGLRTSQPLLMAYSAHVHWLVMTALKEDWQWAVQWHLCCRVRAEVVGWCCAATGLCIRHQLTTLGGV